MAFTYGVVAICFMQFQTGNVTELRTKYHYSIHHGPGSAVSTNHWLVSS